MIKKVMTWGLIVFAAIFIVVLSIFGSAIWYTVIAIARGMGVLILIALVCWFIYQINKFKGKGNHG